MLTIGLIIVGIIILGLVSTVSLVLFTEDAAGSAGCIEEGQVW